MSYGKCKICGCTEAKACTHPDEGPCWWIDQEHELCSHCGIDVIAEDPATVHPEVKKHKISWLNIPGYIPTTWNPVVGCSKISDGCANCYAERMANRLSGMLKLTPNGKMLKDSWLAYKSVIRNGQWNGKTALVCSALDKPLKWKKPHAIFVCSMGDLFHEDVPQIWLIRILRIIKTSPQHIFIILTKRPENIIEKMTLQEDFQLEFPSNVWLGVTAENQEQAQKRIPVLLKIRAAKRFISIEPMLGHIDLKRVNVNSAPGHYYDFLTGQRYGSSIIETFKALDWVICGGESGPKARTIGPDWVRAIRNQCQSANVPFFFKQWGLWCPEGTIKDYAFLSPSKEKVMGIDVMTKKPLNRNTDYLDEKQYHEWPVISK